MSNLWLPKAKQDIVESVGDGFARQWFDHRGMNLEVHKTAMLKNTDGKMVLSCNCGKTLGESTVADPEIREAIHKRFEFETR
jgi:hypothetical protein